MSTQGLTQDEIAQGYRITDAGELILTVNETWPAQPAAAQAATAARPIGAGNSWVLWALLAFGAILILKK